MASKKKPGTATPGGDRHKPSRTIRIPERMAKLMEEVAADELESSLTEQVKNAIREFLIRKGKLPRPGGQH